MAQDNTIRLRDLADANDIYIGAAVYTSHLNDLLHGEVLSTQFNMLTPENEAKFCELQPRRGNFDFTRLDQLVAFAEEHNMTVRGHTLLWHQCLPDWVANGDFTREEAIGIMRDHIYTVVGRYKGRIPIWDVVNEGIDGSTLRRTPWQQFIGDDYMDLAFQFAHEADPDALLYYNDYGAEGLNAKSDAIYEAVADMVQRGIPIHGVGLQAHITLNDTQPNRWLEPEKLAANIQRLGELGLQVQITEMDVKYQGDANERMLRWQAADYYRFMEVCLDSEYCSGFVVWGVTDKFTWLRSPQFYDNPTVNPLLFDDSYQPKPAYFALAALLARRAELPAVMSDDELAEIIGTP
jgi:endo-1,4-beta-xylanase